MSGDTELLWEVVVGSGAEAYSLTTDDGRIFLAANDGGLVRLGADGQVVWEALDRSESVRASPLVDGDTVYTAGRTVFAVSAGTGATRWTAGETYGSVELFLRDDTLYAVGGGVFAVDLDTHRVEKRSDVPTSPQSLGTVGATVFDGVAYVATDGGLLMNRRLADGEPIWRERTFGYSSVTPPVAGDETLFVGTDDGVRAIDPATGADRWVAAGTTSGDALSQRVTDGTLYGFGAGTLHAVRTDGTVQWSAPVEAKYGVDLAVGDDRVFLATADRVTAFDRATGRQQWRVTFGDGEFGSVEAVAFLPEPPVVVVVSRADAVGLRA